MRTIIFLFFAVCFTTKNLRPLKLFWTEIICWSSQKFLLVINIILIWGILVVFFWTLKLRKNEGGRLLFKCVQRKIKQTARFTTSRPSWFQGSPIHNISLESSTISWMVLFINSSYESICCWTSLKNSYNTKQKL